MSRGTVNSSSPLIASRSPIQAAGDCCCSAVVPLFPAVWESGGCRVSAEEEGDKPSEDRVRVAVAEELCDSLEGQDPGDGPENNPEVRHRLRMFHMV